MDLTDLHCMQCALNEAVKGSPSPNPHVGAIVVSPNKQIVGRGFHARPGYEHAEVMALQQAGEAAQGATLYVTLEPCNHYGRTPPCTEAILRAGIQRVVVGVRDPNPHVQGEGNQKLRAAGILVDELSSTDSLELSNDCTRMIAPFTKHIQTGLPYVRLKLASSLDGRIASSSGVSRWITGPEARHKVHEMRTRADAIAVGIGTVLIDDPQLTPRDVPRIEARNLPIRIVFDTHARIPISSQLVQKAQSIPTWVVCSTSVDFTVVKQLESYNVRVFQSSQDSNTHKLDLTAALRVLGYAGIVDLLIEGGANLAGSLIEADCVDELLWFYAPIILGDKALPALIGPNPQTPDHSPRFRVDVLELVERDVLTISRKI